MAEETEQPSEQELRERLEAELRKLTVSDVLVQSLFTVSSLGWYRLGPENRDLAQAKLAIDALRALLPVLEGSIPGNAIRDFNQTVANMQLSFAKAVGETKDEPAGGDDPG